MTLIQAFISWVIATLILLLILGTDYNIGAFLGSIIGVELAHLALWRERQ